MEGNLPAWLESPGLALVSVVHPCLWPLSHLPLVTYSLVTYQIQDLDISSFVQALGTSTALEVKAGVLVGFSEKHMLK